jgi:aminoglycoside phosphotransferase family enzyme/predicted kinase
MESPTTDDIGTQQRVFAFLADPQRHPDIRRIDTHAASVFLESDRALKVKRAVRFPFLDYSTLAKRKAACDEEIRINRPLAPQIYRRVAAITQDIDGSLGIDGPGTPIEFAVEMARFDERQTFDHLAEAGQLAPSLVDASADAIAASHEGAPRAPETPWVNSIPKIIEGYTLAFRQAACFSPDDIEELAAASQSAFSRLRGLLEQRGAQGHVRRCHGDLHLANIVLIEGKPVLFDAIEFDERIASIDVLYDLAFPLMDLLRYGRPAAANALLNRYLAVTPIDHLDALATLPLLMSMRSAIRAHVMLARSDADKEKNIKTARRYFDLAVALIHPPRPTLTAIGGLSGTGKSVLARGLAPCLAPQPGAVVLRSDTVRKQLLGVSETDRLPASAYQPEASERVYQELTQRAVRVLSQGHSVVVDAVFAREAERAAIRGAAQEMDRRFVGFFLKTDLATRQSRVGSRKADASDATAEIAGLQETYRIGTVDWTIVDASGSPEAILKHCQTWIADLPVDNDLRPSN